MNPDLICFYQMCLHLLFLYGTMGTLENFAKQSDRITQGHPVSQAALKPQDRRLSPRAIIMSHFLPSC